MLEDNLRAKVSAFFVSDKSNNAADSPLFYVSGAFQPKYNDCRYIVSRLNCQVCRNVTIETCVLILFMVL